jgi:hypothetical protein
MIAGFFLGMTCVFILLTVTSLVERRLCAKWSLSYFRSGFPAFRQLRRASGLPSIAIDVEKLESLIPDSEHGRLEFRKVGRMVSFCLERRAYDLARQDMLALDGISQ